VARKRHATHELHVRVQRETWYFSRTASSLLEAERCVCLLHEDSRVKKEMLLMLMLDA
jgi:hypothetical protein